MKIQVSPYSGYVLMYIYERVNMTYIKWDEFFNYRLVVRKTSDL